MFSADTTLNLVVREFRASRQLASRLKPFLALSIIFGVFLEMYVRACWMPRKSKTLSCSKQADSYLVLISLQILQHSGPKSGAIIASLRYASSEEGTEGETAIVAGRASDRVDRTRRTLAIFKSISIDRHSERF